MVSESHKYVSTHHPKSLSAAPLEESRRILRWALRSYGEDIVLASSLGPQSLAILDLLYLEGLSVRTVMLDTGMHFDETILLRRQVEDHFGIRIEAVKPRFPKGDNLAVSGGLWRQDPDRCCAIRKLEPLRRSLAGSRAWITGIRRDQSASRSATGSVEWDSQYGLVKVNPLVSWTRAQVMSYLEKRNVPTNPLLRQGYPSIGCRPCTSRVAPGDGIVDERAGRWSQFAKTECGLHPDRSKQNQGSRA